MRYRRSVVSMRCPSAVVRCSDQYQHMFSELRPSQGSAFLGRKPRDREISYLHAQALPGAPSESRLGLSLLSKSSVRKWNEEPGRHVGRTHYWPKCGSPVPPCVCVWWGGYCNQRCCHPEVSNVSSGCSFVKRGGIPGEGRVVLGISSTAGQQRTGTPKPMVSYMGPPSPELVTGRGFWAQVARWAWD